MQRLIFEYNPLWILACLAVGLTYAWLLYQRKSVWSKNVNQALFAARTITVTILGFLLIGPIVKLTSNNSEKPSVVFLVDNSSSIRETTDSTQRAILLKALTEQANLLNENGYVAELRGLNGENVTAFDQPSSDLHQGIRKIVSDYEGKNLAGIVLVSDGIYNSGTSPLYTNLRLPVYTVGIGDTTERLDLAIKNISYNKIAYQGNKFPLQAEIQLRGLTQQPVHVNVSQNGKVLSSSQKNSNSLSLVPFEFLLDATNTGLQRYDLSVTPVDRETNLKNNRATVFVEIVEGKKKILLVSPSPHPDIKALRSTIEKNSNYEVLLRIATVPNPALNDISPEKIDLAIFFQALDVEGKSTALLQQFLKSRTGLFLVLGSRSNLRQLEANGIPLTFENVSQKDDVTPTVNSSFRDFVFTDELAPTVASYPPVSVPFGKFTYPGDANVLLYQKIGSVATARPLLFTWQEVDQKRAILLGEGMWRWRLSEYAEKEGTENFDEIFSKLIQYLSTHEDKRKFRSFPVSNEFSDAEPVLFESQVYNDLFEPIYGNTIKLEIRDEAGTVVPYSYTISPSNSRFRVGGLKEGVYRYTASTVLNEKKEEVRGEFLVSAQDLEARNLTADFGLLRKLASNTGGQYYDRNNLTTLGEDLRKLDAKSIIHSEDSFHPVINLKAVFFLILLLISAEWLTRKYQGAY